VGAAQGIQREITVRAASLATPGHLETSPAIALVPDSPYLPQSLSYLTVLPFVVGQPAIAADYQLPVIQPLVLAPHAL